MCDFSVNWIAWMDGELPPEEVELARLHLDACSECRASLEGYRQVTHDFNAFCDERLASATPRTTPHWTAAILAAGAVAAVLAMLLVASQRRAALRPSAQLQRTPIPVDIADPAPAATPGVEKARRSVAHSKPREIRTDSSLWPSVRSVKDLPASGTAKSFTTEDTESHRENRPALNAYVPPYEPVVEISIPADEMFPPGAVPPGMGFAADLAIAADGSPDRLRLQPRLVGFERRTSVP